MAGAAGSGALEARHISAMLAREFGDLIDVSDVEAARPTAREHAFQTRALAALATSILTGCTSQEAAASVIDGADDFGIDAVMTSRATGDLWLIQAKWSDHARARADRQAAMQLLDGFQVMERRGFEHFNRRLQPHVAAIDEALASPRAVVHLVLAIMGPAEAGESLLSTFEPELTQLNSSGTTTDLQVLSAADFHAAAQSKLQPPSVDLTVNFSDGWFHQPLPYSTYVGIVSAEEVARWYLECGERLFAQNIRNPLSDAAVNLGLDSTLRQQPELFCHFNNGIALMCDSAQMEFFSRRQQGFPARLRLGNASVVNGAQTTAAVYRAYRENPESVKDAMVMVRIMCLDGAPEGLSHELTRAVNTQTEALPRDFITLDPVQAQIRADFKLSLGKDYVLKRGAPLPGPEEGCSVDEAARALACSYTDPALTVLARRGDALWDDSSPHKPYTRLFGTRPSALQIWRSVQFFRAVQKSLGSLNSRLSARDARIADAGRLLIAHIVFQRTDIDDFEIPDADWAGALLQAGAAVPGVVASLIAHFRNEFGDRSLVASIFHDADCAARLAAAVLGDLINPGWTPAELEAHDRPVVRSLRKPSPARLLVKHDRLPDGTLLMYSPSKREEEAIGDWLNTHPDRFLATWTNDAKRPLLWRADEQCYSPSALTLHMWRESGWSEAPVAVNGAARWALPSGQTLAELAEEIWEQESNSTPEDGTGEASRQDGASGA